MVKSNEETVVVEPPKNGLFVGDGSRFGNEAFSGRSTLGRFD